MVSTRSAAVVALALAAFVVPAAAMGISTAAVSCVPLVAAGVPLAEACPPWEALRNGDFELCDDCVADSGDLPRNWSYVPYSWARASGASWTQAASHQGESALALTCGVDATTVVRADLVRARPGEDLAWVVHARGPANGSDTGTLALVSLEFFTDSGSPLGGAGYGSYTDGTWIRYDDTATVPPGAGHMSLQLECRSDASSATVLFDTASLTRR